MITTCCLPVTCLNYYHNGGIFLALVAAHHFNTTHELAIFGAELLVCLLPCTWPLARSQMKQVKLAKSKAKHGDYDMYATRFMDDSGKVLMSCLLHGSNGSYDAASVAAWNDLVQKYGESITFTA